MPTAGRFIIILLIFGAAAHIFLGGGLSFINDYHIWRPIIESSRQKIVLGHNINGSIGQNSTKILLIDERRSHLTSAVPIDNSVSIPSEFYNSSTESLFSDDSASVYPIADKSIANDSINKPVETYTESVNFSNSNGNIHNSTLDTITGYCFAQV